MPPMAAEPLLLLQKDGRWFISGEKPDIWLRDQLKKARERKGPVPAFIAYGLRGELDDVRLDDVEFESISLIGCESRGLHGIRLQVRSLMILGCRLEAMALRYSGVRQAVVLDSVLDHSDFSNVDFCDFTAVGTSVSACDFSSARLARSAFIGTMTLQLLDPGSPPNLARAATWLAGRLAPLSRLAEEIGGLDSALETIAPNLPRLASDSDQVLLADPDLVAIGERLAEGLLPDEAWRRNPARRPASDLFGSAGWGTGIADCKSVCFSGADLEDATFIGVNASGSDFSRASVRGACFALSRVELANFDDAHFNHLPMHVKMEDSVRSTPFVGSMLSGSDFSNASLSGQRVFGCMLEGCSLPDLTMRSTLIGGLRVGGTQLMSDLSRCNFDGSRLDRCTFRDCRLSSSSFKASTLRDVAMDASCSADGVTFAAGVLDGLRAIGCDLSKASFSSASMENAVLSESVLLEASFNSANLSGAILAGANLTGADFRNARFSGPSTAGFDPTVLSEANMTVALFDQCDLRGMDFGWCVLDSASFSKSLLDMASFRGSSARDCDFTGCRIAGTDFADADLTNARFDSTLAVTRDRPDGLDPRDAASDAGRVDWPTRFDGARLKDASFVQADLTRASFASADLTHADFTSAKALESRFHRSIVALTLFDNATLGEGIAGAARMTRMSGAATSFRDAGLRGVDFSGSKLSAGNFNGANLGDAMLREAELQYGQFRGTNLAGANIERADFTAAILEDAAFSPADNVHFEDATLSRCRLVASPSGDPVVLRGAVFRRASLSECDLETASADEFWESSHFCGARLNSTKLPPRKPQAARGWMHPRTSFREWWREGEAVRAADSTRGWVSRVGQWWRERGTFPVPEVLRLSCDRAYWQKNQDPDSPNAWTEQAGQVECPRACCVDQQELRRRANRDGCREVWLALKGNAASLGRYEEESEAFLGEQWATVQYDTASRQCGKPDSGGKTGPHAVWRLCMAALASASYNWGESLARPAIIAFAAWLAGAYVYYSDAVAQQATPLTVRGALRFSALTMLIASPVEWGPVSVAGKVLVVVQGLLGVMLPALFIIGLARRTAGR